ncbi:hypothetical protein ACKUG4_14815 [Pseudomonas glycinae]|uniref:hypothetical protein n=1 Tax=Candidatus Pseudomonas auctus TaxID=3461260 RepID=UPI003B91C66E
MSLKPDFHIRPLILQRPGKIIGTAAGAPVHQYRRALQEISDESEGCCLAILVGICGNYFDG